MRLQPRQYACLSLSIVIFLLWCFHLTSRQLAACSQQTETLLQQLGHQVQLPSSDRNFLKSTHEPIDSNLSSFGSVCHTSRCLALYSSVYQHSRRIPNIRHILWKTGNVSSYFAKQLRTWNDIHPDWNYVLWRDVDLEKFVARYYTGALSKFKSLPHNIMRIDMIRYMILHRYGGVYADLDYVLVRPLDRFMGFSAVVTRETEAHAFYYFGMKTYPPPLLGNPAFMMSEPRHPFFEFCIMQLVGRATDNVFKFAGPLGLSFFLTQYAQDSRDSDNADGVVIVPASRSFYGYADNSLAKTSEGFIISSMKNLCIEVKKRSSVARNLTEYCKDVNNLDPITDRNELVYAIHDNKKSHSSYEPAGLPIFHDNPVDIRTILTNVVMADTIY